MKEDALKFDKYLVALLSNRTMHRKDAPSVRMFLDLDGHFQEFFSRITDEWNRRAQRFYDSAQEKFNP